MPTFPFSVPDWLTPLVLCQLVISGNVLYTLINAVLDQFAFRRPRPLTDAEIAARTDTIGWPSVSVLIPARNEEAVIELGVASLLAQTYRGPLEILVLDDRSDDATAVILAKLAANDARVQPISGGELAPGWNGKPNALRQLADRARGELLLLADADCVFLPNALSNAVAHKDETRADVLSLMPDLVCGSFWEHVVLPLQPMIVFLTLPIRAVSETRNPAFAAANGAFILIRSDLYETLGGHESVKTDMAEDIKFAQMVKARGHRLVYGDGSRIYRVRMYESLAGIWAGFSKNLFSAMGRSPVFLVVWSLFLYTTQIQPFLFLALALVTRDFSVGLFYFPLAHAVVAVGIRIGIALRFRHRAHLWTLPLGWAIVIAMAHNSAFLALSGRGHTWKGRTYAPP